MHINIKKEWVKMTHFDSLCRKGVCVRRPLALDPYLGMGLNIGKFKAVKQKDFQLLTDPDILNLFH